MPFAPGGCRETTITDRNKKKCWKKCFCYLKVTVYLTSLPSFSKKNYFKILKRARVINKNVFSSETQYTRQRVISQLKCVSVMTSCDVFRGKRFGVFHFMWRPFLLFTLAICDLFTPSFRLCWSLLHLYVQKKKEKSPWLK